MESVVRPVMRRSLSRLLKNCSTRYSSQVPQAQESYAKEKIDLANPSAAKWRRLPFIKNFFQGKFDTELMSFPEILNEDDLLELETHMKKISQLMAQKVNSSEIDQKRNIPSEFLQDLKDLGLFGRMIPAKYGGLDLTYTACTRLNEVLGFDWSISSTLAVHEFFATQVILQFGSEEQKAFYLPKLASGNLIAALCCSEIESGSDLWSIQTKATETADGNFVISGSKSWVSNAPTAGIFVVFGKTRNPVNHETVSVFLVEKGEGVHVSPQEKIGLRGLNTGHVHFEEVMVPASNVIGTLGNGFQVYLKALESFRVASSTFTFGALKSLLGSVTNRVIYKYRSAHSLADYQMVRKRLSRVNAMIYAMESASYFTAAILDSTESPDIALEAAALKMFNSEGTLFCVKELMEAVGSSSLVPGHQLERFHRDARALTLIDSPNDVCRLFLGLSGLKLVGEKRLQTIIHMRNPYMFPKEKLKRNYRYWNINRRVFKLDQNIAGHLHPSLVEWGNELEKKLQIFEVAIEGLVARHGRKVVELQIDPIRVASVASELYVWAAVLSRASRACSIGLKNSHHEARLAEAYCHDANHRILFLLNDIEQGATSNNDRSHLVLGEHVMNCLGYFAEHPLKHNF